MRRDENDEDFMVDKCICGASVEIGGIDSFEYGGVFCSVECLDKLKEIRSAEHARFNQSTD